MISEIDDCTDEEIVPVIVEKTSFTYTFRRTPQKALQLRWDDYVIGKYFLIWKSDAPRCASCEGQTSDLNLILLIHLVNQVKCIGGWNGMGVSLTG